MVLSFGLLMPAGAELLSLRRWSRSWRVRLHWGLQSAGVALALLGFAAIYQNTESRGAAHLTSTHGQLGLATVGTAVVQSAGGLLALFSISVKTGRATLLRLRTVRLLHALAGGGLTLLGLCTLRLGLDSAWFHAVATPLVRPAADVLLGAAALRVLYKVLTSRPVKQA